MLCKHYGNIFVNKNAKKVIMEKIPDFWNGWERFWEFDDFSWDLLCFESSHTVHYIWNIELKKKL